MTKQEQAIDTLFKSTEYGGELSAHREEIVTVLELIGVLEREEQRQKGRAMTAESRCRALSDELAEVKGENKWLKGKLEARNAR